MYIALVILTVLAAGAVCCTEERNLLGQHAAIPPSEDPTRAGPLPARPTRTACPAAASAAGQVPHTPPAAAWSLAAAAGGQHRGPADLCEGQAGPRPSRGATR